MQGHLDHRKADQNPLGSGGHGGAKYDRVRIGHRSIEVVLGEPDGIETHLLGNLYLPEGLDDHLMVVVGVGADRENEAAETHLYSC